MNKYAAQSKAVSTMVSEAAHRACFKKRTFTTEAEARKHNPGQSPYKCLFCDGWHLSGGVPKVLQALKPKPRPKPVEASPKAKDARKALLANMVSGWELRRYYGPYGTSHYRLVHPLTGRVAPQSGAVVANIAQDLIGTDCVMHDGQYQVYRLTKAGRRCGEKAKAKTSK